MSTNVNNNEEEQTEDLELPDAFERLWEAVDDLESSDLPDPLDEPEDESLDEPWAAIEDLEVADKSAIDPQADEEQAPDPWSDIDELPDPMAGLPEARPPVVIPAALHMPPMSEWKKTNEQPRQLAWRSSARLLSPDLGELVCVADPASATSRLLVASWENTSSQGITSVSFRVADDGPQYQAHASRGGEGLLDCELELEGELLALRVQLETAREERGLRLGRDALIGHFIVDPSKDNL